jgi:hypothetical protein
MPQKKMQDSTYCKSHVLYKVALKVRSVCTNFFQGIVENIFHDGAFFELPKNVGLE